MIGGHLTATTDWPLFEQYVEQVMKENHIVGAAVAVADESQLLYARGFGVKDLESQDPVTPETIFGCASVSKSFTAMAIAQLAGQGMLAVDNPVIEHIPEFRLVGMKDMCDVKIRHILSHTTGLPPMTRRQDIIDLDEHLRYIASAEYELLGEPGEYFSYCNDTFLLNSLIIQSKSGQLYRRYMTRCILDAAGMNHLTYNLEELKKMGNLSMSYSYNSKTKTHDKQNWPVLGTYEVGGGVRSCVLDPMKYGQIYLRGGVPAGAIWLAAVNTALRLPLSTQKSVEVDFGASPEELARFAGLYRCDEGGRIRAAPEETGPVRDTGNQGIVFQDGR